MRFWKITRRDSIFLALFSSSKAYWERRRDDSLMLATIRDDTWNVLNIHHIIPNSKRWDYSDIFGGGHEYIKRPVHIIEGDHHLRKAPHPNSHQCCKWSEMQRCSCDVIIKQLMQLLAYINIRQDNMLSTTIRTRMWYMISSPKMPTVCLEQ